MNKLLKISMVSFVLFSCTSNQNELQENKVLGINTNLKTDTLKMENKEFEYISEQFADLRVLRYHVEGFDKLTLQNKTLLYYLYEAALSGRDIIYDQNYKFNYFNEKQFFKKRGVHENNEREQKATTLSGNQSTDFCWMY